MKRICLVMLLSATVSTFLVIPHTSHATTPSLYSVDQRLELIHSLLKQVAELKVQLAKLQSANAPTSITLSISDLENKTFCYGQTVNITWNKNKLSNDMVNVLLQLPSSTGELSTVRTDTERYSWTIKPIHIITSGLGGTFKVEESDLYKIYLQAGNSPSPTNQSGMFTIDNCAS